jgi:hypothetical protein
LPFPLGDLFQESLDLVVIVHCLPDAVFPPPGDGELAQLAMVALHQIKGSVPLTAGAPAIGLAAG